MIRLILVALFLILFLLLGIPVLCIEWLIARKFPHAAEISQLRIVQWGFKCILFLAGTRLTVIGEEHVPKDTAVLYIGNHRSFFDVVITYSRCPGLTGYVAKDSMLKVPLLSIWMKRLYCLFLNRNDVKEGFKMILTGIEQIKRGISVCIFPEGTRCQSSDDTKMLPFKEGSMKMAAKTGCPIIPMAITGSADIFENHFPWIRSAHVTLQYDEPIYPKNLSKEEQKHLGSYTRTKIGAMLERI
ncbi:MAG: 1-acyl-sn-glycerol-3-phosphate acyltransferase [Eubacterium sp.]|nr:1-acyl-sn-glycerol-3-phosphate acyltransferase [Eubacterium sp.]